MKLKFDHAYTNDPGHKFFKKLCRMGFTPQLTEIEHPGKHFCRFIRFSPNDGTFGVYIEFIDCRDPKHVLKSAGLSFRASGDLENCAKLLKGKNLNANFTHKNYEWLKNNRDRLPGWNYVTFKKRGFRGLFPWLVEYEKRPGVKKTKHKRVKHANRSTDLVALEIEVNQSGQEFFKKLLGRDLGKPVKLPAGRTIYFTASKRTRLTTIVLKSKSLTRLQKSEIRDRIEWRGRPALVIENPAAMWDIVIV